MRDDFAIFIISYNRANNFYTLDTLKKSNYTGKYYILIGTDDPQKEEYKRLYGNAVIVFDKNKIKPYCDTYDCDGSDKIALYARNVCFKLAEKLNLPYFAVFDDDYTSLEYRYDGGDKLKVMKSKEFDEIVDIFIDFLESTHSLTVAFAQGGDLLGGVGGYDFNHKIKRKAMNSFFCKTSNPFNFFGRTNEDVNMYLHYGRIGKLCFTVVDCSLVQKQTQKNKGGLTDIYNDEGTYVKSFYSVLSNPSCVKIDAMATDHARIHHRINWNCAVPKIISDTYKK